jgi:type I restriction enzyme S subunit
VSFPRYACHAESGVSWIGPFPSHWDIRPLLAVAEECDQPNKGMIEDNLLSLSYGRIINKDMNSNDGLLPESFETYQVVEPDDIVWRLTDLQNDKRSLRTAIVRQRGIITSAYLATRPHGISPAYLNYLLRAYDQEKVFYSMGGGLRQSMKYADVKRLPILIPSAPEQLAISAFLDRETAKIDELVNEQRQLIGLLKEKRQAVISRAVSKGLDPTVRVKESGAEWLGEVPGHWQVIPLKRRVSVLSGYAFPSSGFSMDPADTRLLRGVNVAVGRTRWEDVVYWARQENDGLDEFELREGDIVLGMDRPWIGDGLRVAQISAADLPCLLLQRVTALRPAPQLLPAYLQFLLASEAFYHHCVPEMTGVSVPHISPTQVGDFVVALPPPEEQLAILESIAQSAAAFEPLIVAANEAVDLLGERRAALISAAVTGKIDVREAAHQAEAA